ncbi:MAG: aminopeptidase P N-terminal domain-containing protein [Acutalibacter sp.]
MNKDFYKGNRERLYAQLQENSLLVLFAGVEVRKTNDEFYPFYTNRNFLYLTGLDQKELALIVRKDGQGQVAEKVYILPPDWMAERWTGTRIKPNEATDLSGIQEIGYVADFEGDLHKLATSGNYQHLYLDLYRSPHRPGRAAHLLLRRVAATTPSCGWRTPTPSSGGCAPSSSLASWKPCARPRKSPARASPP